MMKKQGESEENGERLQTASELAKAAGVSKMTVLRELERGRLAKPARFTVQGGQRQWLWSEGEYHRALRLLEKRAAKRVG